MTLRTFLCGVFYLFSFVSQGQAGPLRFQFTNPSFGGNPFASAHFLGLAEIQKIPKEKTAPAQTQVERFEEQLQSRVLSALSSQITRQFFEGDLETGEPIQVGDITVIPTQDGDTLTLTILQDGSVTEFSVDTPTTTN